MTTKPGGIVGLIVSIALIGAWTSDIRAGDVDEPEESADATMVSLASFDYIKVQRDTEKWVRDYEHGSIGGDEYFDHLRGVLPRNSLNETWGDKLREWTRKFPQSYAASFLLGLYYEKMAFQLRGGQFASQTTAKQAADLKHYATLARTQLLVSSKLSSRPYPSYCVLVDVAMALDGADADAFFDAAEKVDPAAVQAWENRLNYLAPKWGGSGEKIDAWVGRSKKSELSTENKKRVDAKALEIKANDAALRENYELAVKLYRDAYHAAPNAQFLWRLNRSAAVAKKGGLFDRAIETYAEVVSIDPVNVTALNGRGYLLETKNRDLAAALADYQASARTGNDWAQNKLGWWYMTGNAVPKDFTRAKEYFEKAAAQGNKNARANLNRLAALKKAPG